MEALSIETPYGHKLSCLKATYQDPDGKAAELHLHTIAVDGKLPEVPRIDPVLRLVVNGDYAVELTSAINLAATGLACDEQGRLKIRGYQWVGDATANG